MTIMTSLVSSVSVSRLKINDLLVIVSMTYDSSLLEKQHQIYGVVIAAYKEAREVVITIDVLALPCLAQVRIKGPFVPSHYELDLWQRGVLSITPPPSLTRQFSRLVGLILGRPSGNTGALKSRRSSEY